MHFSVYALHSRYIDRALQPVFGKSRRTTRVGSVQLTNAMLTKIKNDPPQSPRRRFGVKTGAGGKEKKRKKERKKRKKRKKERKKKRERQKERKKERKKEREREKERKKEIEREREKKDRERE